ncbi:formate dehydrogenase subunit gamma [Pseudomonas sp. F1_0610]|uniref:formate dehydrogenase subunit gamma n=1 Tax=Pseudomonas sp. F1_0610 TaxID=3114284 RepID=UPI0039C0D98E
MNKKDMILRTPFAARACHWIMVICFFLTALSGLSWVFPSLSWLNSVLGTPQMARILHPFLGVAVFLALVFMFFKFVKYNMPEKQDKLWVQNIGSVMAGKEDVDLQIGKYNAGQKFLFWSIMGLISLLLITGVVVWRPYFAPYFQSAFGIDLIRIGLFLHSLAGVLLILLIIGHIYLGIWVKGSISGMVTGYVSRKWAKQHHSRWYREDILKADKKTHE